MFGRMFGGRFRPGAAGAPPLVTTDLPIFAALLRGVWHGAGWGAHTGDAAVLPLMVVAGTAVSSKVFRWE